jgi:hypothetical protein
MHRLRSSARRKRLDLTGLGGDFSEMDLLDTSISLEKEREREGTNEQYKDMFAKVESFQEVSCALKLAALEGGLGGGEGGGVLGAQIRGPADAGGGANVGGGSKDEMSLADVGMLTGEEFTLVSQELGRLAARLEGEVSKLITEYVTNACNDLGIHEDAPSQNSKSSVANRACAAGDLSNLGRLTAARTHRALVQNGQEQLNLLTYQHDMKRLKSALKKSTAENLNLHAQLRAAQREKELQDLQERALADMMKTTLEQVEQSHNDIVSNMQRQLKEAGDLQRSHENEKQLLVMELERVRGELKEVRR